jgi:hypothetical protein
LLLASFALASLFLAACGDSEEDQVADAIRVFYRAAAEGDGEQACEHLTSAARNAEPGIPCEVAIDQLGTLGGERAKRRLEAVRVRNIKVRGDEATAEAQIPTQNPTALRLRKVGRRVFKWKEPIGEWKIDSAGMAPGGAF